MQSSSPSLEQALQGYYGCFEVMPSIDGSSPSGSVTQARVGPFGGCIVNSSNSLARRSSLPTSWNDNAFLMVNSGSSIKVDHYGKQQTLTDGTLMLLDSREACDLAVEGNIRTLTLNLDRGQVLGMARNDEAIFGHKLCERSPSASALHSVLFALANQGESGEGSESEVLLNVVLDLLNSVIDRTGSDMASPTIPIARMRRWLEKRLGDAELGPAALAHEFGYSERSLYRLFADAGTTPGKWIWSVRLDKAHARLCDAAMASTPISTIAYELGFQDAAHFTRRYRERFGHPPREARRGI